MESLILLPTDMNNFGWQNLIVCGASNATNTGACGFSDLIALARAVMTDLTILATLLVIIAGVMIGFTLMTSEGSTTAKDKAKNMAWTVLKGYFFIIIAWVLVYTISGALLASDGFSLLSGLK
jgi:hypothetical protein